MAHVFFQVRQVGSCADQELSLQTIGSIARRVSASLGGSRPSGSTPQRGLGEIQRFLQFQMATFQLEKFKVRVGNVWKCTMHTVMHIQSYSCTDAVYVLHQHMRHIKI